MTDVDLSLEDELIDHLADPESAMEIYKARFSPDLLNGGETDGRMMLDYVVKHIEEHGEAPAPEVISHALGGTFADPVSSVGWLIDEFRARHRRNNAKKVTKKVASLVVADPDEALRVALTEFGEIERVAADVGHTLTPDNWDDALREYEQRVEDGMLDGVTFGFPEVDEAIGGLRPYQMAFLVGRPKSTKSWLLLKSAVEAMWEGTTGTFITAELSVEEMYGRFQCMAAGVSYSLYQHGHLSTEDWQKFEETGERIRECKGRIDFVHPAHDQRSVADLSLEARRRDAEVVWFDQFRFATPRRQYEKAHAEMESIVYDIKAACEHQPWYVAAQFNREAAGLMEMADLSQIGLTDAIGQAADHVLGIHRSKDMIANNLLQLGVIATRGFKGGTWEIAERIGKNSNLRLLCAA